MGDLEVLTSNARICFADHHITAATKSVRLDVNVPMKPKEEQTLDDYMHGGAIKRLDYRWSFDPKGQGTPGTQMPGTFVAGDPTTEPPNAHPTDQPTDQPPQQPTPQPPVAQTPPPSTNSDGDLVAAISARSDLKSFLRYITRAGLVDTLHGAGPFTVCSATDAAFARLPPNAIQAFETASKERMQSAFGRMMVQGAYPSATLGKIDRIRTLDPSVRMSFGRNSDGRVKVCDGEPPLAEILARNGILYVTEPRK